MREMSKIDLPIDRDSKYMYGMNERLDVLISQLDVVTRLLCEQYKIDPSKPPVEEVTAIPATSKSRRKA